MLFLLAQRHDIDATQDTADYHEPCQPTNQHVPHLVFGEMQMCRDKVYMQDPT